MRPDPDSLAAPGESLVRLTRVAQPGLRSESADRAAFDALMSRLGRGGAPRRRMAFALLGAAAVAAALAVVALVRSPVDYVVERGMQGTNGYVYGPAGAGTTVRFSDGTVADLEGETKLQVAATSRAGARVELLDGAARVHVRRRPGARWSFGAGPYSVAVTGTAFDLRWSSARALLEVALHSGSVVVTGPALGGGVKLVPGQTFSSRPPASPPSQPEAVSPDAPAARNPGARVPPTRALATRAPTARARRGASRDDAAQALPPAAAVATKPSWAELLARGDYESIVAHADEAGAGAHASARELRALADAARYLQRRELAQRTLRRLRADHRGTDHAAEAAFLLGRMDEPADTARAVAWYDSYLAERPAGAYASDALGRKMLLLADTGDRSRAREAANDYLRRFPAGPYATRAKRLLAR